MINALALLLTCSHGAQDLINSFFLFVEENSPTQTDDEVRVLFQESVLVSLDQVGEGWETVGYSGNPLHLEFVSLQGGTAAHLRNTRLTSLTAHRKYFTSELNQGLNACSCE